MNTLPDLSASELLARYAAQSLTPVEYCTALLEHIEAWEPHIRALWAFDSAKVMAQAEASSQRWQQGRPQGALDGVPVTIKELIATQGDPVPLGSAATELTPALADAPPAARLREAGAILIGKTTSPDYGMLSSGLSSFHQLSRNPWNLANNPGGSSAGAASAAAAGYGPLHVGTDIGGSIRLPAGWCGLVGFKPSLGRVPIDPYYTGRVAGPMTRTVADCALLMRTLSLPDARDATSLPPQSLDWSATPLEVRGLRIGLMLEPGCGLQPEAEVCAAVQAAAALFSEHGAHVEPARPLMSRELLDGMDHFWRARLWAELSNLPAERLALVLPYIRDWAAGGAQVSGVQAVRGFNQTFDMRRKAAELFSHFDLILSPTNQVSAFPAHWASPTNDPQRPFEHIAFTLPWNMGEQPALSINCGYTEAGMPIGLQMIGPRFADDWLLRVASSYESWRGPQRPWPAPPAG